MMIMRKLKTLILVVALLLSFSPFIVRAQADDAAQGTTPAAGKRPADTDCSTDLQGKNYTCLRNPLGSTVSVPVIMGRIINAILGFVGSITFLLFIYGGFQWLTSAGNDEKVRSGTEIMKWAIIGLVVILASYALLRFVFNSFTSVN